MRFGRNATKITGRRIRLAFYMLRALSAKASFEHSVRLPLSRELLGNGTIYPNLALNPESSDNINFGLFGSGIPASGHSFYYEANGFFCSTARRFHQATVSEKEGMMQCENMPAKFLHIKGG